MNKNYTGIGSSMSKGFCLALALVLAASLFAAGASAVSNCGKKCCIQSRPMDMHHSKGKLKPSAADTCNADPRVPCDLKTGQSTELLDSILSSVGGGRPNAPGLTDIASGLLSDRHNHSGNDPIKFVPENSRSAPIYLQNLSFLI